MASHDKPGGGALGSDARGSAEAMVNNELLQFNVVLGTDDETAATPAAPAKLQYI